MLKKESGSEGKIEEFRYKLQENYDPTKNLKIHLPDGQSIYVSPEEHEKLGRVGCIEKYYSPLGKYN